MRKQIKRLNNKQGLTFVEVLISLYILMIGAMGTLLCFTSTMAATQLAKDMTTATIHGELILEEMHLKTSLTEIEENDWDVFWNDFVVAHSLEILNGETIDVEFASPYSDLLTVTVTVNWETKAREHTLVVNTEFKKDEV